MQEMQWIGGMKYTTFLLPCNESIVRLCDAMHRDLPKQGNKARRALTIKEGAQLYNIFI